MIVRGLYDCKLVRVIDGDTLIVEFVCPTCGTGGHKRIRLARIDAPEKIAGGLVAWNAAKHALESVVLMRVLKLHTVQKWPDRYGRIVAELLADGQNVSNAMLASGHAVLWRDSEAAAVGSELCGSPDAVAHHATTSA